MTRIHSILIGLRGLFNVSQLVAAKAPIRSFEFLYAKFVHSAQHGGNLMNLKNVSPIKLSILLFNIIKRAIQNPTRLFRFTRTRHNSLKEGIPMKLRELYLARLAALLFNLKPFAQVPIRSSGSSRPSGLWDMFCNKFAANPSVIRRKFLAAFIQQTTS
jgi:hypothetical protein